MSVNCYIKISRLKIYGFLHMSEMHTSLPDLHPFVFFSWKVQKWFSYKCGMFRRWLYRPRSLLQLAIKKRKCIFTLSQMQMKTLFSNQKPISPFPFSPLPTSLYDTYLPFARGNAFSDIRSRDATIGVTSYIWHDSDIFIFLLFKLSHY